MICWMNHASLQLRVIVSGTGVGVGRRVAVGRGVAVGVGLGVGSSVATGTTLGVEVGVEVGEQQCPVGLLPSRLNMRPWR